MDEVGFLLSRLLVEMRVLRDRIEGFEVSFVKFVSDSLTSSDSEGLSELQHLDAAMQECDGLVRFLEVLNREFDESGRIDFDRACEELLLMDMKVRLSGGSSKASCTGQAELF